MNILWIYDLPLNPEAGGTERITSLVAKGFSQRGHNCLGILVFDEQRDVVSYEFAPVTDLYEFLCEHQVDVVINQIAYAQWLLERFLEKGGGRWHQQGGRIVSCLHFDPKNPSLLYMLQGKHPRNLADRLNIAKAAIFYKYYEHRQQQRESAVYNYIYENSDRFVVLSATHFQYLEKIMQRREYDKLAAINNPLTFEDISAPEILDDKKKVVLVCARMSEYHKRISMILQAWSEVQKHSQAAGEWVLKLVGTGPDLQRYTDYARTHKLSNVQFEGQQSPEPYYREASMLLLTSSAEGWGLTITEGLQRGVVPVVMNSCSVFCEIIQDGENGYLTPNNDIEAFGEKIAQLMTDPAQRRQMQLNALTSATKFSLESTMDKWEQIINPS